MAWLPAAEAARLWVAGPQNHRKGPWLCQPVAQEDPPQPPTPTPPSLPLTRRGLVPNGAGCSWSDVACVVRPGKAGYCCRLCRVRPRIGSSVGNSSARALSATLAQFPEGIIINYEERKIISLDKNMVSQHNPAGYGTPKKPVCDNQEIETYVHWHLSLYLDFMTDKRMSFDEFIAEHGILSLQPKKQVSTMNCGPIRQGTQYDV
jgi:hypothetical protein